MNLESTGAELAAPEESYFLCSTSGSVAAWRPMSESFAGKPFDIPTRPQANVRVARVDNRAIAVSSTSTWAYPIERPPHEIWVWDVLSGRPLYPPHHFEAWVNDVEIISIENELLVLCVGASSYPDNPVVDVWRLLDGRPSQLGNGLIDALLQEVRPVGYISALKIAGPDRSKLIVANASWGKNGRPYGYRLSTWDLKSVARTHSHLAPKSDIGKKWFRGRYYQDHPTRSIGLVHFQGRQSALIDTGFGYESTLIDLDTSREVWFERPGRSPSGGLRAIRAAAGRPVLLEIRERSFAVKMEVSWLSSEVRLSLGPECDVFGLLTEFAVVEGELVACTPRGGGDHVVWRVASGRVLAGLGTYEGGGGITEVYARSW